MVYARNPIVYDNCICQHLCLFHEASVRSYLRLQAPMTVVRMSAGIIMCFKTTILRLYLVFSLLSAFISLKLGTYPTRFVGGGSGGSR